MTIADKDQSHPISQKPESTSHINLDESEDNKVKNDNNTQTENDDHKKEDATNTDDVNNVDDNNADNISTSNITPNHNHDSQNATVVSLNNRVNGMESMLQQTLDKLSTNTTSKTKQKM